MTKRKSFQIISGILISLALYGVGILCDGVLVGGDVWQFSGGIQILAIIFPLIMSAYAVFIALYCAKHKRGPFFVSSAATLILSPASWLVLVIWDVLALPELSVILYPAYYLVLPYVSVSTISASYLEDIGGGYLSLFGFIYPVVMFIASVFIYLYKSKKAVTDKIS